MSQQVVSMQRFLYGSYAAHNIPLTAVPRAPPVQTLKEFLDWKLLEGYTRTGPTFPFWSTRANLSMCYHNATPRSIRLLQLSFSSLSFCQYEGTTLLHMGPENTPPQCNSLPYHIGQSSLKPRKEEAVVVLGGGEIRRHRSLSVSYQGGSMFSPSQRRMPWIGSKLF